MNFSNRKLKDPSGLALEREKNNTVQAGGSDIISSGYTGGFWAEKTISVYEGSFKSPLGLDNPLAPAKRIKYDMYGSETSYVWIGGSSGAGGGGGGMATPKSGEGASSSQNSSKKTYNNTTSKSMRDQNAPQGVAREGMRNTLYANEGGIELLEKYFGVRLTRSPISDHFDLYEISGFTVTDPRFQEFHEKLNIMIHNNKRPLILSTNQEMNTSKSPNRATIDNKYNGEWTAFVDVDEEFKYRSFDGNKYIFNHGQITAHEFFGHIFNYFSDLYLSTECLNTEINAVNSSNRYMRIRSKPQRSQYDEDNFNYNDYFIQYYNR